MRIFKEVPPGWASDNNRVVEDGNFYRFHWLFVRKL